MGKSTVQARAGKAGGGFSLPPGYLVRSFGRLLSDPGEPVFWNLYRHEETTFGMVADSLRREDVERVAWRDHLRRTLEVLAGVGCCSEMPEGYGLFEYQGEWVVARPDDSVVCTFSIYATADRTSRVAWDDYRRRTFRVLSSVGAEREDLRCG